MQYSQVWTQTVQVVELVKKSRNQSCECKTRQPIRLKLHKSFYPCDPSHENGIVKYDPRHLSEIGGKYSNIPALHLSLSCVMLPQSTDSRHIQKSCCWRWAESACSDRASLLHLASCLCTNPAFLLPVRGSSAAVFDWQGGGCLPLLADLRGVEPRRLAGQGKPAWRRPSSRSIRCPVMFA